MLYLGFKTPEGSQGDTYISRYYDPNTKSFGYMIKSNSQEDYSYGYVSRIRSKYWISYYIFVCCYR